MLRTALATLAAAVVLTAGTPASAAAACDLTLVPGQAIGAAVNGAPDGAMTCLRGGIYAQSPSITDGGASGLRKRLRSYPGEIATILGRLSVKDRATHVIVSDLVLDGSTQDLPNPQINGDDVLILRNEITNRHHGICMSLSSSPSYGRAERIVVRRNIIHNCGKLPPENHHHGVYASAWTADISYNLIINNADRGVQLYSSGRDQDVHHNVICDNGQGGNFSGTGTIRSTFRNNVLCRANGSRGSGLAGPWVFYEWNVSANNGNALRNNCLYANAPDPRFNVDGGVDHGSFAESGNYVAPAAPVDTVYHVTDPTCRALVGDPVAVMGTWPKGPPR